MGDIINKWALSLVKDHYGISRQLFLHLGSLTKVFIVAIHTSTREHGLDQMLGQAW